MSNLRRRILVNAFKLWDIGLMLVAFFVAAVAVLSQSHAVTMSEFFSMRVKIQNFVIFTLFLFAWHLSFSAFGLYASRRFGDRRKEALDVLKATSLGTLIVLAGSLMFQVTLGKPRFFLVFWAVTTVTAICSRLVLRVALAAIRKNGRNLRDILVVGTNGRALAFVKKILAHPELGYRVIGFVDQEWGGTEAVRQSGFVMACDFDGVPQYLRNSVVDEVVMALPMRSLHFQASQIAAFCEEQGIVVRQLSNIFDLKLARSSAEEWEGGPLITHRTASIEGSHQLIKRVLDIVVSGLALLFLSPVFLIALLLIKLTSPGPVFFVQKRLGWNKRRFEVFKFRTMVVDAEKKMSQIEHLNEVSGPVFKIKNDPRITSVGKVLRRTSIDELPQLLNVFLGDMSLVGPRPLPVRDYEGFNEDWQRRRFSVKPGITCLWQVKGRSEIPFEQWMELDLQYIDKWSLWLDVKILLRTIPAVLRGSGAA